MKIRESIGLALAIAAITVLPFGYWLSVSWYFVALALGVPGLVLFFTDRNLRNYDPSTTPDADTLPSPSGGLRGFHGSRVLDSFPDTSDGD